MAILNVALVLVDKKVPFSEPQLATLADLEKDFLERHVDALRKRVNDPQDQYTHFKPVSSMPQLLAKLQKADDDEFQKISILLARRLYDTMLASSSPNPPILSIVTSSANPGVSLNVSILKLDATREAARFRKLASGYLRLHVLKDLLPAPEQLQKGFSWPDPRPASEAIIRDRNVENALYFLNAYDIVASEKAKDAEKQLLTRIAELPYQTAAEAYQKAVSMSGPAPVVAARLKQEFPALDVSDPVFDAARPVAANIRPNKLAAQPLILHVDGIEVHVPPHLFDRVHRDRDGDGWVVTIRSASEPRWIA